MALPPRSPAVGVGVVCFRGADEVLLVRRARPPREGEWSLPGGRLEWAERLQDAATRELSEETGVSADIVGLLDVVDGLFTGKHAQVEHHFVLVDFLAEWTAGEPHAADDAAEAAFVPLDQALRLVSWDETRRVIASGDIRRRGGGHGGAPQPLSQKANP